MDFDVDLKEKYLNILREELIPAMGCTEPTAVAYCAACAGNALKCKPDTVTVYTSANIIKNVKSVIVPNTNGLRGIEAAAAAGLVSGKADAELQVLAEMSAAQIAEIPKLLETIKFNVEPSDRDYIFDIQVSLTGGGHSAFAEIAGFHTNLIRLERDGEILLDVPYKEDRNAHKTDRACLSVERIIEFAESVDLDSIRETLERQIQCNTAIAEEGLRGDYGASIGKILLKSYGNSVHNRAKAYAAAGSDSRMNGCDLPVVINSGSGNQGLTASLPVIVYAEELKASHELLLRALIISNLVTIHLKTGVGELSAYCGATSAGCGAAAGITYLYGGRYNEIAQTIVNAIAINSGMVCDGAKASCAAKIASAVEAGLLGMKMQMNGSQFCAGDGLVAKGVENTINNFGNLAKVGMRETDRTIIRMMTE